MESGRGATPEAASWNVCGVHVDRAAVFTCERCGTFGCSECVETLSPRSLCRECAARGAAAVPWERRASLGLVRAFVETSTSLLVSPSRFFSAPATEGLSGGPSYGILAFSLGMLGLWVQFAVAAGVVALVMGSRIEGLPFPPVVLVMVWAAMIPLSLVQAPIQAAVNMALALLCVHPPLIFLHPARRGWEYSARVVGYAQAAYLWLLVPGVGMLIAYVHQYVLEIQGIKHTHDTGWGTAVAAVLLVRVLLVAGSLVLYLALAVAAFSSAVH